MWALEAFLNYTIASENKILLCAVFFVSVGSRCGAVERHRGMPHIILPPTGLLAQFSAFHVFTVKDYYPPQKNEGKNKFFPIRPSLHVAPKSFQWNIGRLKLGGRDVKSIHFIGKQADMVLIF